MLTFSCVRRLSTTTCEWSALCLFASYALPADRVCKSAIAAFMACMSCLMTPADGHDRVSITNAAMPCHVLGSATAYAPVSSLISAAGSSNMLVRLASCASLLSFCEVLWMPKPIRDARFANSECCVAPAPLIRGLNPVGHVLRPSAMGCEGESPVREGGGRFWMRVIAHATSWRRQGTVLSGPRRSRSALHSERSQYLSMESASQPTEVAMFTCFASLSAMAVNSAVLSLTEFPRNGGMPMVTLTCSCPCTRSVLGLQLLSLSSKARGSYRPYLFP